MLGKLTVFTLFLCFGFFITLAPSVSGTDIEDIRAAAIKKLEDQNKIVDEYRNKVGGSQQGDIIPSLVDTRVDHANVLAERTYFEMGQVADGYKLLAQLLKASKDVIKCMDEKMEQSRSETEKFFIDKFYRDLKDQQYKWGKEQLDRMFQWVRENAPLFKDYKEKLGDGLKTIKNSNEVSEIKTIVDTLFPMGEKFIIESKKALDDIFKYPEIAINTANEKLNTFRQLVRRTVDNFTEVVQDCFFVSSNYYTDIKTILNTVM